MKKPDSAIYHEMVNKHIQSGQLFVFIRKFAPDAHEYGGAYAGQLQTYAALTRYISDNWWRGEKCAFAWTLQDGDDVVATGTIPFSEDRVRQKQIEDFLGPQAAAPEPQYPELARAALPWTAPSGAQVPMAPAGPPMGGQMPPMGGQMPPQNPMSALAGYQYGAQAGQVQAGFQAPPQPFYAQPQPQMAPQFAPSPRQYQLPPVAQPVVRSSEEELAALRRRVYELEAGVGVPGVRQFQPEVAEEEEEEDPTLQKIAELEAMVQSMQNGVMPNGHVPGQPFQPWQPGQPGHPAQPGHPGQYPGMPGHYPQYVQQAPPQPQDEMALMLAKMKQLREFTEAMGVSPSRDIDVKIREMEQKMWQQQQQHAEALNNLQMKQLMDQIAQLKNERKTELSAAKQEPEEKEKLPPFEDVNGIKIPRDPETGELDYNFSKIAALNSGTLMEQIVAVLSIYKDNKDSERKVLIAQAEAAAAAARAHAQQAPMLQEPYHAPTQQHHHQPSDDDDVAAAPSPKYAERAAEPQPDPSPPERQQVSFVAPPRPAALEDAPPVAAEKTDDGGVCAT